MIRNIVFDLGGVLLTIDAGKTIDAFTRLGWKEADPMNISKSGYPIFENIETGSDKAAQFRKNIRERIPGQPTDDEIDHAWCAMLIDFPSAIINYLIDLKSKYNLYLLSNTNEIHLKRFRNIFYASNGYLFDNLFVKTYYSHEIGFRKPNLEAYVSVLDDASLKPGQSLFVDDLKANTNAAESLGMKVLHIEAGTLLQRLPEYLANF
jgi:HAD superfamily hydrolase (TIGR01509 family)